MTDIKYQCFISFYLPSLLEKYQPAPRTAISNICLHFPGEDIRSVCDMEHARYAYYFRDARFTIDQRQFSDSTIT